MLRCIYMVRFFSSNSLQTLAVHFKHKFDCLNTYPTSFQYLMTCLQCQICVWSRCIAKVWSKFEGKISPCKCIVIIWKIILTWHPVFILWHVQYHDTPYIMTSLNWQLHKKLCTHKRHNSVSDLVHLQHEFRSFLFIFQLEIFMNIWPTCGIISNK